MQLNNYPKYSSNYIPITAIDVGKYIQLVSIIIEKQ